MRGNTWSAEPKVSWPGWRLLHDPSTVRSPLDTSGLGIWSVSVPTSVPQGLAAVSVFACRSAISICFRMNFRSVGVTVNP